MRGSRRLAGGVLALLVPLVLALAGCSGDDEPADDPATGSGGSASGRDSIPTTVQVGEVSGRLPKAKARKVAQQVAATVDRWIDAAYVGGERSFPGFSKGAARMAAKQAGLMSNAQLGDRVDGLTVTRRVVAVDVLAPRQRPAGATARVNLVFEVAGSKRREQVRGRLLLTPARTGWRVFGFDVERGTR